MENLIKTKNMQNDGSAAFSYCGDWELITHHRESEKHHESF